MKKTVISLLISLSFPVTGRDPFIEPENVNCVSISKGISEWKLTGIVGNENHYKGWLNSKNNVLVGVESGSSLPFSGWYVNDIFPFQLSLKTTDECGDEAIVINIEENPK